ncbi:MAG: hypothetical protein R3F61_39025 [Myxococcota bacterium]
MDQDELQLEKASALPMGGVHATGVALHALSGLLFASVMLLGPQVTPEVGEALTTPRVYGAGLVVFGTALSIGFSTGLAVVVYRTVGLYPRWSASRQRMAMFAGLAVAHLLGCLAGIAGILAMITTTFVG